MFRRVRPSLVKCDAYGNNLLHQAVRHGPLGEIKFLLSSQPLMSSFMAKKTNDYGCLPYDVIEESRLDYYEKSETSALLLPLMREHDVKPLSQPINVDAILASYYPHCGPVLLNKLKLACDITNKARSLILDSDTHPQINDYDLDKSFAIRAKVRAMRKDLKLSRKDNLDQGDFISITAKIAIDHRAGNCGEMSYVVLDEMRKQYQGQSELCFFENADHAFVVMDRGQGELRDYKSWGPHAIFCDPLLGKVYLGCELENKLSSIRCYSLDNVTYSIINVPFNPRADHLAISRNTVVMDRIGLFASKRNEASLPDEELKSCMRNAV